ncbi:hypothetical protein [Shewanella colwelliana]|uniref:hypothetical protein n=1 Tax=Shewanella colwelliana TaxID=23 RepID=UPI003734E975
MLLHFAPQIVLAFIAALIVANTIKATQNTRFHYKTPTRLQQGFVYAKGIFILRVIALWLCLSIPLYILFYSVLTVWGIFITLVGCPAIAALIITPELNTAPNAKLVITKPLLSRTATLHLKAPYQDFDRQTYQELFTLVECLPQYGIKKIALNSPMFYDTNGKLRSMNLLEKGLNKQNARLSHSPARVFDCLLGKISMLASRDKQKHIKKHNVTLLKWHKIVITL